MFQGLSQGAMITVLFKNVPRVADGRVLSVNTHMPTYNPQQPMAMMNGPVTDITVQIGNDTVPFVGLPANGVIANFQDKGIFLSTDKSAVVREVEAMANASRQILESVPAQQKMVKDCEALLLELNPERKKEAQQAEEMNAMRGELAEMKKLLLASLGQSKPTE
jgi:hypothetical protein